MVKWRFMLLGGDCACTSEELFMSKTCQTYFFPFSIGLLLLFPFVVGCSWFAQTPTPGVTTTEEPETQIVTQPEQEPAHQDTDKPELSVAEEKPVEPTPQSVADHFKSLLDTAVTKQKPVEKPIPVVAVVEPVVIPEPVVAKTQESTGISASAVVDQISPVEQALPVNTGSPVSESPVNETSPVSGWDTLQGDFTLFLVRWIPIAVLVLQEEDEPDPPVSAKKPPAPAKMATQTPQAHAEDGGESTQGRVGGQRGEGDFQQSAQQVRPPRRVAQAPPGRSSATSTAPVPSVVREPRLVPAERIEFSFRSTSWKDVIEWFADQAALNLQADKMPVGSLNLSDNQPYTPTEALDILNAHLLIKNYALIRRDKTLFVHYLPDGIPPNLLEPITAEELDSRGKYEICRCVFNLNRTTPDIVQTEVERLLGPQGNILPMPRSQQIVITETVGTLRTIRDIIRRIDDPDATVTGSLQMVEVSNLTAEDAVQMMRRLLTIDEADPSLRTVADASGKKIFLSGRGDMIERAKSTITRIDESFGSEDFMMKGQPQFETYDIGSADPTTVLAVLQTLLAQMPPDTRLSLDPRTNGILVYGRLAVHLAAKEAIKQMQLNAPKVEIIPLRRMSPVTAVETIKKFYATYSPNPTPSATAPVGPGQQGQVRQQPIIAPSSVTLPPTVEADMMARQIIVRGTGTQIAEIRALLTQLGEDGTTTLANATMVRAIPLSPAATTLVLEQLQAILPKLDPNIKVNVPVIEQPMLEMAPPKGEIKNENDLNNRIDQIFDTELPVSRLMRIAADPILAQVIETPAPQAEVTISVTPAGIVLTSNDPGALEKLEGVIRMLSDESVLQRMEMKVYYLTNSTATVVSSVLQNLMGVNAGPSASGVASVDLPEWQQSEVMGLVSTQTNTIEKTGIVTISVDERLNALYVQANAVDHKTIEKLLRILDQPSREGIMTKAVPRLVKLEHMRADEARPIVETAFANRMQGNRGGIGGQQLPGGGGFNQQQPGGRGGQQQGQQPTGFVPPGGGMGGGMEGIPQGVQQALQALGQARGGGNTQREQDPGMTVGVYAQDNSLIVTAPEALFLEVEAFVRIIDAAAAEKVTTISHQRLVNVTPDLARQTLTNLLGSAVQITNNRMGQGQFGGGNFGGMNNFGGTNNFGGGFQRPMGNIGGGSPYGGMGNLGGMVISAAETIPL